MDLLINLILYCFLNVFSPREGKHNTKNEDLVGFFFGTSPWGKEDKSIPINKDYDQGPDW